MTQLERLIARLVQLVEDNTNQVVTVTVIVGKGIPVCWAIDQTKTEGMIAGKTEGGTATIGD